MVKELCALSESPTKPRGLKEGKKIFSQKRDAKNVIMRSLAIGPRPVDKIDPKEKRGFCFLWRSVWAEKGVDCKQIANVGLGKSIAFRRHPLKAFSPSCAH
jgi:hypothetical protein